MNITIAINGEESPATLQNLASAILALGGIKSIPASQLAGSAPPKAPAPAEVKQAPKPQVSPPGTIPSTGEKIVVPTSSPASSPATSTAGLFDDELATGPTSPSSAGTDPQVEAGGAGSTSAAAPADTSAPKKRRSAAEVAADKAAKEAAAKLPKPPTLEEVRAALTAVSESGKRAEIQQLLKEGFKVEGLSKVPPALYAEAIDAGKRIAAGESMENILADILVPF